MFKLETIIFKNKLIQTIALLSGIVTILMAFTPANITELIQKHNFMYLILFIVFNLFIAFCISKGKREIILEITNKIKVHIYSGDILAQNGIIIIPVNEYFDTLVDDNIISSNSLHGIFEKQVFGGNIQELDNQISSSLDNQKIVPQINNQRLQGKKDKYPLGTVATIKKDGKTYFLVALTRFNDNNRAEVTKEEYQHVLIKLFKYIEQFSQGQKANLPLLGAGRAGIDISKQKLLELLLMSLVFSDKLTLERGLDIVLHESVMNEISLNKIEMIFNLLRK